MPPKKKSKKKKSSKGKKGKGDKIVDEDAYFREIYATLREQERVDTLVNGNDSMKYIAMELRVRLEQYVKSQAKLVDDLDGEITKKDSAIAELKQLRNQLLEENQAAEIENAQEIHRLEEAHIHFMYQLQEKRLDFGEKNAELTDFIAKRHLLEGRLKDYRQAYEDEVNQRAVNVKRLHDRNIQEKNRLETEMQTKIKETKLFLLSKTEDQLHTTTKRTIIENEQMTTEIKYQARETDRIQRGNLRLAKENRDMKRKLFLHEQHQNMLATRTRFFHKLVVKLTNHLKSLEVPEQILIGYSSEGKNLTRKQAAINDLLSRNELSIKSLETRVDELEASVKERERKTAIAKRELAHTRKSVASMVSLQEEAVALVLQCLDDCSRLRTGSIRSSRISYRTKVDEEHTDPRHVFSLPKQLKDMSVDQRETFLRMLLFKLNFSTS